MLGQIAHIDVEKGFGFVKGTTATSYYFKTRNCNFNAAIGNKVAFEIKESPKGYTAIALRKVFENNAGLFFFPRINAHHIHLNLEEFLPPLINQIGKENTEEHIELEYEFPHVIGESHCIPTQSSDRIIYAIRKGRTGHTRFVLDAQPRPCKTVFAVFKKVPEGYLILTIFIGKKAAREPWDVYATKEDVRFWQHNALIFDEEIIIRGSELTECPWNLKRFSGSGD